MSLLAAAVLVAQLSGTVTAADGAPVTGATVVVRQVAGPVTVATDASGAYRFDDVSLPATVEVSAPGFATMSRLVMASPADFRLAPASLAESVVVAGERAPAWRAGDTGATVLDARDLALVPALTLDEGVRVISGFSLFRRSSARQSNPTTHGVTMRGLSASGASRGLVLMDGVVLNDGFGGWVTWTRVPALAIDRVDVTRGASGDAFGSDAVGGVLQVVPPSGREPSWLATASTGTLGLAAVDASAGGAVGDWVAYGAGSWLTTDGSIPVEPDSRGPVDRTADAEWANGFGQATGVWGTRRLSITGWGGRDDRGNGTVLQRNRMSGGTMAGRFDATGRETTFAARLSASPNSFHQTFTAVNASRTFETLTSTQTTDTLTTRAVVEGGRTVPHGHVLARAELSRASADFTDVRQAATTAQSLVDRAEAVSAHVALTPAAAITVNGGVRHEWRAAPEAGDGRDTATVGHVRAVWNVASQWFVRGSVASSHRWPTLNELVRGFRVGNVITQPNPDLRPERARSFDGALAWEAPRWQASVGGFWTDVVDAIANITLSTGATIVRERQNAGDTRSKGLEVDAEIRPGAGARIRTSLALTSATFVTSSEAVLTGNDLPQVPRAAFSLWVDVPLPHSLVASGVFRSSSSQFDDDRNTFELSPAAQLDLGLSGRFRWLGWRIELENALDADIEVGRTPLVTLAPPRAFRVAITVGRE
jgi:outer membrane receptor protein involved in Fe transport